MDPASTAWRIALRACWSEKIESVPLFRASITFDVDVPWVMVSAVSPASAFAVAASPGSARSTTLPRTASASALSSA